MEEESREYQKYKEILAKSDVLNTLISCEAALENPACWNVSEALKSVRDILNELKHGGKCPFCGGQLYLSDLPQYNYTCPRCEENFFGVEVEKEATSNYQDAKQRIAFEAVKSKIIGCGSPATGKTYLDDLERDGAVFYRSLEAEIIALGDTVWYIELQEDRSKTCCLGFTVGDTGLKAYTAKKNDVADELVKLWYML